MGHDRSEAYRTSSETILNETIEHLLSALEAAKQAPEQDLLVRLIEAVILHAGSELAQIAFPDGFFPLDDV